MQLQFRNMATSIEALTEDRDASQTQYSSIINTLNAREEQEQVMVCACSCVGLID